MKLIITLIIIILILFIICIYLNRMNNINSINVLVSESFSPNMSQDVLKGSSMLYGWKTQTYNPDWAQQPRTGCCSCDTTTDDTDES